MTSRDMRNADLRDWLVAQERRPDYLPEVFATTSRTRQRKPSRIQAWLPQAPVFSRRDPRTIALVGIVLAALLSGLLVVGAILRDRNTTPPQLIRDNEKAMTISTAQLVEIVRSTYQRMPDLPPLVLTAVIDGTTSRRVYVGQAGAVRIESFATPDATGPSEYEVYSGGSVGQLIRVDGTPLWYGMGQIAEDPGVFVYSALQGAGFQTRPEFSCPGGSEPADAFDESNWTFMGLETVVGRPAYHLRCGGEVWIDAGTGLVLRSVGPRLGVDGTVLAGMATIEATRLEFTVPSAELFEVAPPAGVATATEEQFNLHQCRRGGSCLASPRQVELPPPASAGKAEATAEELVARVLAGTTPLPAYEVEVSNSNTGRALSGQRIHSWFDGTTRYRTEILTGVGTAYESSSIWLDGEDYHYIQENQPNATGAWRNNTRSFDNYPLWPLAPCDSGWRLRGVDLVAGRVADHVACSGTGDVLEMWIDRELNVVVRAQTPDPFTGGISIDEIVIFRLGASDAALFELPPGSVVEQG